MIKNTSLPVLDALEEVLLEAEAGYESFSVWYKAMSGLRGGVLPKMPLEEPHLARCVMYLARRHRVEMALPQFKGQVETVATHLEDVVKPEIAREEDPRNKQILTINFLLVNAFVSKAKFVIEKAEEHINRSHEVDDFLAEALEAAFHQNDVQISMELNKLIR